jgi:hypothetical protein
MTTHNLTSAFADRRSAASVAFGRRGWMQSHPYATGVAVAAGVLAVTALANHLLAKRAERRNPPSGRFLEVDGVRLHYIDRGEGEPLVLLHGNGSMIEDFTSSGLLDLAARRHRVIVLDSCRIEALYWRLRMEAIGRGDPFEWRYCRCAEHDSPTE